jgi:hypothetical protein
MRQQIVYETCQRILTTRPSVPRTVDTMIGRVRLERPYFYCRVCREGVYPLDEALGLTPGRNQLDVQKAAAKLVIETSYDEAQALFHDLTTWVVSACTRLRIKRPRASVCWTSRRRVSKSKSASRKSRRVNGAYSPTRPESARGRRPGQSRQRARRPTWKG